jgi:hypothetical protein
VADVCYQEPASQQLRSGSLQTQRQNCRLTRLEGGTCTSKSGQGRLWVVIQKCTRCRSSRAAQCMSPQRRSPGWCLLLLVGDVGKPRFDRSEIVDDEARVLLALGRSELVAPSWVEARSIGRTLTGIPDGRDCGACRSLPASHPGQPLEFCEVDSP